MKKVLTVSFASFMFLAVSSAVAYALSFTALKSIWACIGIGVGILILSGILAIFAKKNTEFNIICSAISAASLGFLIRAWYLFRGFENPIWVMLLVSLAEVVYLWLFYALAKIKFFGNHIRVFASFFILLSVVIYTVCAALTETTFLSTFGYYMIIEIAFIFAMCKSTSDGPELIRAITLSTYSVFIVAIIVAIAVIFDGDLDFDLDFDIGDIGDSDKKTKKKNNKSNQA